MQKKRPQCIIMQRETNPMHNNAKKQTQCIIMQKETSQCIMIQKKGKKLNERRIFKFTKTDK